MKTMELYEVKKNARMVWHRNQKVWRFVVFVGVENWPRISINRRGCRGLAVVSAPLTAELDEEVRRYPRALCWQYAGDGQQDAEGLGQDLRTWNFGEETVKKFVKAARVIIGKSAFQAGRDGWGQGDL
jgi:hypothetical protein